MEKIVQGALVAKVKKYIFNVGVEKLQINMKKCSIQNPSDTILCRSRSLPGVQWIYIKQNACVYIDIPQHDAIPMEHFQW